MVASQGGIGEHRDGRSDQALDRPVQVGSGHGKLAGQDDGAGAGIRSGVDRRRQGGQGNALKAKPEDSRRCEDRREGDGKAMLELRARIYCRKVKVDD